MIWLQELFSDETDRASMSRFLLFQSFYASVALLFIDTIKHGLNEILFGAFLAAYTGTYIGGKWADRKAAPAPVVQAPIVLQQAPAIPVKADGENVSPQ